jgi:pyridoxal phosphate enzyme (YggS family)
VIDSAALQARLATVRDRIAGAAGRVGRDPASVRLVAISKNFSAEAVRALAAAGHVDFGENRVQEALQKMDQTADLPLCWHLVGHLQSNKARKAGSRFAWVHSVDSPGLLQALDRAAEEAGRTLDVLIQVDMAGEPTKHGVRDTDLRPIIETAAACRAARLMGLMLLPPAVSDPEDTRPAFRALVALRTRLLAEGVPPGMLTELSMGMSHDFEIAVEEGATTVRVGTAIFGSRPTRPS